MAFQPIIDIGRRSVYAYEALVRGPGGEGAATILSRVNDQNRYGFDQSCRVRAIELAARLGLTATGEYLSINFFPGAVYHPKTCIQATLAAASRTGFPPDRLIFEMTEGEAIVDHDHLNRIFAEYRRQGFLRAIDDFGAGYAGLCRLAMVQPDLVKIDMALIRNIDQSRVQRVIVSSIVALCTELDIVLIAEGVETAAEMDSLRAAGVSLFQGYLFAEPAFEALPRPRF